MNTKSIIQIKPLSFPWPTHNPFLFCVYHQDIYPPGNEKIGPAASLEGRTIGHDFTPKNDWRIYHGETVPGKKTEVKIVAGNTSNTKVPDPTRLLQ